MNNKKEPLLEESALCCGFPMSSYTIPTPKSTVSRTTSPFDDDSYKWPNLYEEAYEMNLVSIILYGLIDLRNLARQNKLTASDPADIEALLKLPITADRIVRMLARNRESIITFIGEENTEAYVKAFDAIVKDESLELEFDPETGKTTLVSFDVVKVDDIHPDEELVYGACVDSARKRITVVFRGCSSRRDWRISLDHYLSEYSYEGTTVAMHRGFSQYLFAKNPSSNKTSYEAIVETVKELLQIHPTYHIYVTGHSLGAALATVFTHRAAMTEELEIPISCINFASPMVGNNSFEVSFKYLQREGRIRCLRVTNDFDIFTQLPDRSRVYRHVGINLRLYSTPGRYKITHPRASARPILCRLLHDWKKYLHHTCQRALSVPFACFCDCCYFKVNFNTNHSIVEHMKRLQVCSDELQHHFLNDLYEEKRMELI